MDKVDYIAEASLIIEDNYPFERWLFIWDGEIIIIHVNKETSAIVPFFDGRAFLKDIVKMEKFVKIEKFVERKLKERQDGADLEGEDEDEPDPESGD